MAEQETQAPEAAFTVQKLYLKDVSFESPSAPEVFRDEGKPNLKLNLAQKISNVGEDTYEVILTVTVTAKLGESTAYLAEVAQAGVFTITGFEEEQLQATLGAYCPTVLFPYARQAIADLVLHGGFQPLLLQPINFDQVYAEQVRKRSEQMSTEAAGNA